MVAFVDGMMPGIVGREFNDEQLSPLSSNGNYMNRSAASMDINSDQANPSPMGDDVEAFRQMIRHLEGQVGQLKQERNRKEDRIRELEAAVESERQGFGRNNLNKNSWDNNDMWNEKTINAYIRQKMFQKKKFLAQGWDSWQPNNVKSLCYKLVTENEAGLKLPPPGELEWYWRKRIVAIVNKKYVELRSNANSNHKAQYMSKEKCCLNFNCNQAVWADPNFHADLF